MIDDVTRRIFVREAAVLGPVLYEHLDLAVAGSSNLLYSQQKYPHAHALHRRAIFREGLEGGGLPNGWRVAGNPRQTGQTILRHEGLGAALRVLSESTVTTNGVPLAGANHARRVTWRSMALFDMDLPVDRDMLLLMDMRRLEPSIRIVHPTEPGRYRGSVACDFGVSIIREIDTMGDVSFDTSEDYVDFFVKLEDEESGDA